MSEPKPSLKRLSLLLRFQTIENQIHAPLVKYLNNEDLPYKKTEMFLQALSAFWQPFALKWMGSNTEEVSAAAAYAIKALSLQIALLENQFGIVNTLKVESRKPTNRQDPSKDFERLEKINQANKKVGKEDIDGDDLEEMIDIEYEDDDLDNEADITDEWMNNKKSI